MNSELEAMVAEVAAELTAAANRESVSEFFEEKYPVDIFEINDLIGVYCGVILVLTVDGLHIEINTRDHMVYGFDDNDFAYKRLSEHVYAGVTEWFDDSIG